MPDPRLIASSKLTAEHRATLSALFSAMIPANEASGLPSAGDDTIVNDFLESTSVDVDERYITGLTQLDNVARERCQKPFAALSGNDQESVFQAFNSQNQRIVREIGYRLLECYYRDDRVLIAYDLEPRAPFPKGFEVPDGDWSVLERVKRLPKLYRRVSPD